MRGSRVKPLDPPPDAGEAEAPTRGDAAWFAQSLGGLVVINEENAMHGAALPGWGDYVVSPDFWDRTLQNWQSEFLAVGTMVGFSIYLRQRGSAESKPVGTPHHVSSEESD